MVKFNVSYYESESNLWQPHLNKELKAKSGLMEEALAHLKDAIVEEPKTPMYGFGFQLSLKTKKTNHLPKKALEIDPGNRPAQRGLAFIERKKYIPPKPGEKLSDYTHPIGVFKSRLKLPLTLRMIIRFHKFKLVNHNLHLKQRLQ